MRLAVHAMATRFELVLAGDDPVRLRAAGEDALAAIEAAEAALSPYRSDSFAALLARVGPHGAVRVPPAEREWLRAAVELVELTGGAFDPCWQGPGRLELADDGTRARLSAPGTPVDLGAIGKGVALDRAADELRDAGVARALLHGGTSTVLALGSPPGRAGWGVRVPLSGGAAPLDLDLSDRALSVSAQRGRDRLPEGGHVVDARDGARPTGPAEVACTAPRATLADAWSTAVLAVGATAELVAAAAARGVTLLVPPPGGSRSDS